MLQKFLAKGFCEGGDPSQNPLARNFCLKSNTMYAVLESISDMTFFIIYACWPASNMWAMYLTYDAHTGVQ